MNRDFAATITTAVTTGALALSSLAMPTLASAQDRTMAWDSAAGQTHVIAHHAKKHGWLTTMGPDSEGHYAVSIDIADLDATGVVAQARLAKRIQWAASILCDMTAPDGVQSVGFYDAGARKCRDEVRATAMSRLSGAQHAATLTFGRRTIAR